MGLDSEGPLYSSYLSFVWNAMGPPVKVSEQGDNKIRTLGKLHLIGLYWKD